MPSKSCAPDAEDRLQVALIAWRIGGLYCSLEACANAYAVTEVSLSSLRALIYAG